MPAVSDHFVRADVRAFLDELAKSPRPEFTNDNIAELRELVPVGMAMLDKPVGELAETRDVVAAESLPTRLFDPRSERGPGPVVIFFHGGGFVVGSVDSHAALAAEVARSLDLPVVSVDYWLASENVWPAAPDDAEAAIRWIAENDDAYGRSFDSIVLCGDSAGATLSLVSAMALRDRPAALPVVLQIPIYPAADPLGHHLSNYLFAEGFGLDRRDTNWFRRSYRPARLHWRAAPLNGNVVGLAPTVLATASCDPLRDSGRAFATKLVEAGVPTAFSFYEASGMIHGFATYRKAIPSADDDVATILNLAKTILTQTR